MRMDSILLAVIRIDSIRFSHGSYTRIRPPFCDRGHLTNQETHPHPQLYHVIKTIQYLTRIDALWPLFLYVYLM
jgi:hypothetical protein